MAGWVPYYHTDLGEVSEPTCDLCAAKHLRRDENGECELIPTADQPAIKGA